MSSIIYRALCRNNGSCHPFDPRFVLALERGARCALGIDPIYRESAYSLRLAVHYARTIGD